MSWFNSILDMTKEVGTWMENNQTAANILGGAAVGGVQYLASKEAAKDAEEQEVRMYERRLEDELNMSKASTGSGSQNYEAKLSGGTGLLTNGILAKRE